MLGCRPGFPPDGEQAGGSVWPEIEVAMQRLGTRSGSASLFPSEGPQRVRVRSHCWRPIRISYIVLEALLYFFLGLFH